MYTSDGKWICYDCINDEFIKSLIITRDKTSTCDYCSCTNKAVIEVSLLKSHFEPVLELYKPVSTITFHEDADKLASKGNIIIQLNEDWNFIFEYETGHKFLKDMLGEDVDIYQDLFDHLVLLEPKYGKEFRQRNISKKKLWSKFKKEIIEEFRFLGSNQSELKEFKELFSSLITTIPKGEHLYRSRISKKEGFDTDELGAPPKGKAVAGRVNPKGIPYLYLTRELITSIAEVRAGTHDYVSIAKFDVKEQLEIVNFQPVKFFSPFKEEQEQLKKLLEFDGIIQEISQEMSKPNRRFDSDVDYIPTQFIVELVKAQSDIDGVEYTSSMSGNGRNVCLFTSDKVEPIGVEVKSVEKIDYITKTVD